MTVAELESRVVALEHELTKVKEQLVRSEILAGIKRGMDAADAGQMAPAREVLEKLRQKHNISEA